MSGVVEFEVVSKKSDRTGKDYKQLVLKFDNGYVCTLFLNNEQAFCIEH